MNVTFWQTWFKWAQAKIISLAKSGDFLALAAFLGEFGEIGTEFVRIFESLQTALKGKWYQVGLNLLTWAKANPDPAGQRPYEDEADGKQVGNHPRRPRDLGPVPWVRGRRLASRKEASGR
jgi:hypothetical protein